MGISPIKHPVQGPARLIGFIHTVPQWVALVRSNKLTCQLTTLIALVMHYHVH